MKKTMKFLCMTALVLVGAVMTGCSNDDDSVVDNKKVVTLTTTIGFEDSPALTRALDGSGNKTFAEGDKLALIYKNSSDQTVRVESSPLTLSDINGRSAKFSFVLENQTSQNVAYIYPASMANNDGSVKTTELASQDGTLTTLSESLDCCVARDLSWDGSNLPGATLYNQFAILAITLMDNNGTPADKSDDSDIQTNITNLVITVDGITYTVKRPSAADAPIYVAINPASSVDVSVSATSSDKTYTTKELSGKTYAAGHFYNITWRMTPAN